MSILSEKEMREAAYRYWEEERSMNEEELAVAYLRFESNIVWIDPEAKNRPWLREHLDGYKQRSGPIAKTKRNSEKRVVAYIELKLDTPRHEEGFYRRSWYLMPGDGVDPNQIPSEARVTSSIQIRKPSRHPSDAESDDKPP